MKGLPFCPRQGFQKRFGANEPGGSLADSLVSESFAEFFAELRAETAPNCPFRSHFPLLLATTPAARYPRKLIRL